MPMFTALCKMQSCDNLDPSSFETVLEVYHLPRDTWNKEIEDIKPKLVKSNSSTTQAIPLEEEVTQPDQSVSGILCLNN